MIDNCDKTLAVKCANGTFVGKKTEELIVWKGIPYATQPVVIALMISVSSSFATPIGSPTHMLVYAPGGYRFSDFMRIGLLMNIIILAANIFIVNIIYPLTPLQ